jgi:hypothetical protein
MVELSCPTGHSTERSYQKLFTFRNKVRMAIWPMILATLLFSLKAPGFVREQVRVELANLGRRKIELRGELQRLVDKKKADLSPDQVAQLIQHETDYHIKAALKDKYCLDRDMTLLHQQQGEMINALSGLNESFDGVNDEFEPSISDRILNLFR